MQSKRFSGRVASFLILLAVAALPQRCLCAQQSGVEAIRYNVDASNPATHTLHITMHVPAAAGGVTDLAIPAWTPGYYQILDFSKDIRNLCATDKDGKTLRVEQPNALTWRISSPSSFRVDYDVNAVEPGFGFFRCHADAHSTYINGAAAFLYVINGADRPCTLTIRVPNGWRVVAPLDPLGPVRSSSQGTLAEYQAQNYEDLIDAPIQSGDLEQLDFRVSEVPFSVVLVGQSPVDRGALEDTIRRIAGAGMKLFGSVPFKRYVFIIHFAVGSFGGGLEHRASCVLNVPSAPSNPAHPWAALIAHEYFHAWNVKRIRPVGLGPFDLSTKVRTPSLWFAEGVTDYYSQVLLRMANLTTPEEFLGEMARRIELFDTNPAHLRISAEEASRRAWEGGSMGYGGLDYYIAGSVLGFMLDIEIRAATAGRRSLDDVMRLLDHDYGSANRAYPETAILDAVNKVAGRDLSALYNRCIKAPARISWNEVLGRAGLALGGPDHPEPYLGVVCPLDGGSPAVVEAVDGASPAAQAGIQPGDVLAAMDGAPVNAASIRDAVARLQPGQSVVMTVKRGMEEAQITVRVGSRSSDGRLLLLPDADPVTLRIRDGLLRKELSGNAASPAAQVPTQSPSG
ncbi:MAG: M61 family metallopeptidase [Chthonomonadales bacterium]